jgi:hypothetical protein
VNVEVTDGSPERTGFAGDIPDPDADPPPDPESDPTVHRPVPEYILALHSIGDELHTTARLRGSESPESTPSRVLCEAHPDAPAPRGQTGLGYVHADIDLAGEGAPAEEVTVEVVSAPDDPRGADPAASLATVSTDRPIDAQIELRLINVVASEHVVKQTPPPFNDVVGDACLDFDLPIQANLTDVTVARLSNEGGVFAVDVDGDRPTAVTSLRIGEPTAEGFRAGAPFAFRSFSITGPTIDNLTQTAEYEWKDVVAAPIAPQTNTLVGARFDGCPNPSVGEVAYIPGVAAPGTDTLAAQIRRVKATVPGPDGVPTERSLDRAKFVLELFLDPSGRQAMADSDLEGDHCPFTTALDGIAGRHEPPATLPAGNLDTDAEVTTADFTMTRGEAQTAGPDFCGSQGWSTSAAYRPADAVGPDFPVAVGADGTRYDFHLWSTDNLQLQCRVTLVARHPNGAIRWRRELTDIAPWLENLAVRPQHTWRMRLYPNPDDGSIEAQISVVNVDGGESRSITAARLDTSGQGGVFWGSAPSFDDLWREFDGPVGTYRVRVPPTIRLEGGCTPEPGTAPEVTDSQPAPADIDRVWYLGDGTKVTDGVAAVHHCYSRPGKYYIQLVDYRDGVIVRSRRWLVEVPSS